MHLSNSSEGTLPPSYDDVMAAEKGLSKQNVKVIEPTTPAPPPLPILLPPSPSPSSSSPSPATQPQNLPELNAAHGSTDINDDEDDCRIMFKPNNDDKDGTVSA